MFFADEASTSSAAASAPLVSGDYQDHGSACDPKSQIWIKFANDSDALLARLVLSYGMRRDAFDFLTADLWTHKGILASEGRLDSSNAAGMDCPGEEDSEHPDGIMTGERLA